MKRLFLNLFIVPALLALIACGSNVDNHFSDEDFDDPITFEGANTPTATPNGNEPEIAEENPCQGLPNGCIDLAVATQSGILELLQNQKALKEAHEAYVQELKDTVLPNATVEEVAEQWKQTVGYTPISSLHENLGNLNKFFQFVRVSQGQHFQVQLEESRKHNYFVQSQLEHLIDPPQLSTLESIQERVKIQRLWLTAQKNAILKVAEIYGVELTELSGEFDALVGPFASEVTDRIAENVKSSNYGYTKKTQMLWVNLMIAGELTKLLPAASLQIGDTGKFVSFVNFLLMDNESFAPNGEYLIVDRLYGAFNTAELSFIE